MFVHLLTLCFSVFFAGSFSAYAAPTAKVTEIKGRPDLLFNEGLTRWKAGEKGYAVALWRSARLLDPSFKEAKDALRFFESTSDLLKNQAGGDLSLLWQAHLSPIDRIPTILVWVMALIFLGLGLAFRKVIVPIGFLCVCLVLVGGFQIWVRQQSWATALKTVQAKTGPIADAATLFDITEGEEVIVNKVEGGWAQVSTSQDRLAWIPESSLMLTGGDLE